MSNPENKVRHDGKAKKRAFSIIRLIVAIIVTCIFMFPLYWMFVSSLKSSQELLLPVPTLWPKQLHWSNYADVLRDAPFGRYFFNTIVMTLGVMILQMITGIFAAYGFSKGRFKGRDTLFVVVLGALMIPIQVTFVPLYVMMAQLHWLNSFAGLIIPDAVSAYFIFMLRQAFMSVDNSYLEAAQIDGMGRVRTIFSILCPMCKPTLITVGIFIFVGSWNSYFWPKMITTNPNMRTVAIGVVELRRTYAGLETMNYNQIMAGALLAMLPIVVLFFILQRYIMEGMSKAAMK
jgi:ABC-type glycerol-3-phosphate transport system permease component